MCSGSPGSGIGTSPCTAAAVVATAGVGTGEEKAARIRPRLVPETSVTSNTPGSGSAQAPAATRRRIQPRSMPAATRSRRLASPSWNIRAAMSADVIWRLLATRPAPQRSAAGLWTARRRDQRQGSRVVMRCFSLDQARFRATRARMRLPELIERETRVPTKGEGAVSPVPPPAISGSASANASSQLRMGSSPTAANGRGRARCRRPRAGRGTCRLWSDERDPGPSPRRRRWPW